MLPLPPELSPLPCVLVAFLLARTGAGAWAYTRPLVSLALGLGIGALYRASPLPAAEPEAVRAAARFGLAVLVFAAAQQCRFSRLSAVSSAALRLAGFGVPILVLLSAALVFALLPGLGVWSAVLVAVALPLGAGVFDERAALRAPLADETKRALRLDLVLALTLGIPLAVAAEAVSQGQAAGAALWDVPAFGVFAGGAVGGTIGLLGARWLPVKDAAVPAEPFLVFAIAYLAALLLGFDAVIAAALCGVLYSEEATVPGPARSRIVGAGLRWVAPLALFSLAATLGATLFRTDLLVWLSALVPALFLRIGVRRAALTGAPIPEAERRFLSSFGGAPGAGAALFTLSLLGADAAAAQGETLTILTIAVTVSVLFGQLASDPLVARQVRAAARAKKRRYAA